MIFHVIYCKNRYVSFSQQQNVAKGIEGRNAAPIGRRPRSGGTITKPIYRGFLRGCLRQVRFSTVILLIF
jgi:hypothetical protein